MTDREYKFLDKYPISLQLCYFGTGNDNSIQIRAVDSGHGDPVIDYAGEVIVFKIQEILTPLLPAGTKFQIDSTTYPINAGEEEDDPNRTRSLSIRPGKVEVAGSSWLYLIGARQKALDKKEKTILDEMMLTSARAIDELSRDTVFLRHLQTECFVAEVAADGQEQAGINAQMARSAVSNERKEATLVDGIKTMLAKKALPVPEDDVLNAIASYIIRGKGRA